ncbi:hypothetical protein ACLOAV_004536 [Pseudogymnoascus australis]
MAISIRGTGRTAEFNAHILPLCRQLVEATGQRMAYEAAQASKDIPSQMLNVFVAKCVEADLGWYCVHEGSNRMKLLTQQVKAYEAVLPQLEEFLDNCQAAPWATSPILKEKDFEYFSALDNGADSGCVKMAEIGNNFKVTVFISTDILEALEDLNLT